MFNLPTITKWQLLSSELLLIEQHFYLFLFCKIIGFSTLDFLGMVYTRSFTATGILTIFRGSQFVYDIISFLTSFDI
jgi:hypothetical protein